MTDPFALLSPEIAAACRAAVAIAVDDYRAWAKKQFAMLEQADGSGPDARNARQYLYNGRGIRVFGKREAEMMDKGVNNAEAALAKNADSLRAITQLEFARRVRDDAVTRLAARDGAGAAKDAVKDPVPKPLARTGVSPAHLPTVGATTAPLKGPAEPVAGRSGSVVRDRIAARRALKGRVS